MNIHYHNNTLPLYNVSFVLNKCTFYCVEIMSYSSSEPAFKIKNGGTDGLDWCVLTSFIFFFMIIRLGNCNHGVHFELTMY